MLFFEWIYIRFILDSYTLLHFIVKIECYQSLKRRNTSPEVFMIYGDMKADENID